MAQAQARQLRLCCWCTAMACSQRHRPLEPSDEPLPPDGVAEAAQREPSGVLWRIIDRRPFEGAVLPATERKCGIPL